MPSAASDERLVAMLVDRARSKGLQLAGYAGLFAAADEACSGGRA